MPATVQKSAFASMFGTEAIAAAKEAVVGEVKWGPEFSRLPPGIKNGVAKLTYCGFEEIDKDFPDSGIRKGDIQYRARGVMLEPESVIVNGEEVQVAGLQTSEFPVWVGRPGQPNAAITRNGKAISQGDQVQDVIMKMRRLGANFPADPRTAVLQLEAVAKALNDSSQNGHAIYFNVNTTVKKAQGKNPEGVWENWNGVRDVPADYAPPDAAAAVQDDTETGKEPFNEFENDAATTAAHEEAGTEGDEVDVDELAAAADNMDISAALAPDGPGTKLLQAAEQVGADVEACKQANTWADAAAIINAAIAASGGEESAAEPEPTPPPPLKKGDAVSHWPVVKNPKTGKLVKSAKAVPCEISAVNNKAGTCDLTQLANRKVVYKGVKLGEVERAS